MGNELLFKMKHVFESKQKLEILCKWSFIMNLFEEVGKPLKAK